MRFMVAIDNFEHVALAYGAGVADHAVRRLRAAVVDWLGDSIDLHFASGGIVYGTWQPPLDRAAVQPGRGHPTAAVHRLLVNPPVLTLAGQGGIVCLSVSGTLALDDEPLTDPQRPFAGGCRAPYFGALPGRGESWAARYRVDMATAARVLGAMDRLERGPLGKRAQHRREDVVPLAEDGAAAAPFQPSHSRTASEQLVLAWRPVRDGRGGPEVLFYEMCPRLVGPDGCQRDLSEMRPALERLGLAVFVDRYLVDQALDLLAEDPDVALAVPISAQSASACSRWGDTFRRLTGDRSVARRLTLAIAETSCFPDFAETIQFVSRLQTFGVAVAVDNFGLGYTSIRELLALAPDIVCIDAFFVRFGSEAAPEGAALAHLAGLAQLLAATVVVKGVTNERQSRLSLEAGIRWQQGDFLGTPSMGRAWMARTGEHGPCRLQERSQRRPRAA